MRTPSLLLIPQTQCLELFLAPGNGYSTNTCQMKKRRNSARNTVFLCLALSSFFVYLQPLLIAHIGNLKLGGLLEVFIVAIVQSLSWVWLSRPRQAPLSLGFSRWGYWSGLPYPSVRNLSDPGIEPVSPALTGLFFTIEPPGKPSLKFGAISVCKDFITYHLSLLSLLFPSLPFRLLPSSATVLTAPRPQHSHLLTCETCLNLAFAGYASLDNFWT